MENILSNEQFAYICYKILVEDPFPNTAFEKRYKFRDIEFNLVDTEDGIELDIINK